MKGLSKGRYDETFAGEVGADIEYQDLCPNCLQMLSADDKKQR